jgi:hypothetical protein
MAYWSFVKLCTVVVHYLQMFMKEYGCCPIFKRGDNSTYTFLRSPRVIKITVFVILEKK